MQLLIGNTIKYLRRERGITQEDLAEVLGVSCQSVSRWENNTCYPDIELLPTIANFFGITVDNLLGVDDAAEAEKVEKYLSDFQNAISRGDIDECIRIARAGVAEYPNNYKLLNKLMYALFLSGDSDGNIPQWQENMKKYDAEITMIGERIMKYCPDPNIRFEAIARLARNHCEMGRTEIGKTVYEALPPQTFCKETRIWWALSDEEKPQYLHDKVKKDYESLQGSMWLMADYEGTSDNDAIHIFQKVFELENLIYDGQELPTGWGKAKLNFDIAKRYIRIGQTDTALKHLQKAADAAYDFDNRPDIDEISCMLFGTVKIRKTDFETADTRSLCKIMLEKWLGAPELESVKDSEEYKNIVEQLKRG